MEAGASFFEDDALSHSAAISFYAATALAPIILIIIAIAGFAFGQDAAHLALSAQISGLAGPQGADLLKGIVESAATASSGLWASIAGTITRLITASGVFGGMQSTLNKIWKVEPPALSVGSLIRARALSLGLVAALGFLLIVSLAASAAIAALSDALQNRLPLNETLLWVVNFIVSFSLISLLFAAIYKVLPDRRLGWRDVAFGAVITAALFTIGKSLIGWYLGTSTLASSYGAAGGLLVVLVWIYYSSVIFLFGAEITRSYSTARIASRPRRERVHVTHEALTLVFTPAMTNFAAESQLCHPDTALLGEQTQSS